MIRNTVRRGSVALTTIVVFAALAQLSGASAALASTPSPLPPGTHFFTPLPSSGAVKQIVQLVGKHDVKDAALIAKEVATPQAVWFTKGTPAQVKQSVRTTALESSLTKSVPTLVVYNVPGRDCSQYSSGGAGSDAAYQAWASGFAAGLIKLVEVRGSAA